MKIAVYTNTDKDKNFVLTNKFISLLHDRGCQTMTLFKDECAGGNELTQEKPDILAVFGGDGTILSIAAQAAKAGVPVLGINMGYLGFLTEIENDKLESAVDLILAGKFFVEERTMLMTECGGTFYHALNDIVLQRDFTYDCAKKIVNFQAYAGGSMIDSINSDGLIISTPTGSTAYSLSAGGPILSPHIGATLITAICPHTLHTRPIVLSDTEKITVKIGGNFRVTAAVDGYNKFTLSADEKIEICKSPLKAKFVRIGEINFYNKLINKLNKWSTTSI